MKYSKLWLQELTNINLSTEKLAEQLTMAGLEVGSIQPVAPKFHGVVIGEVLEVNPHPNANKLTLCKVDVGANEYLDIVCGAPNVRKQLKVPVALIGAELPNNLIIKKAKLRGMDSSGMLCSANELGLSSNAFGILELPNDASIGTDIREYLSLDDEILEIDLTSNRGDCLSMLGVAREIAAINKIKLPQLEIKQFETYKDTVSVKVLAEDGCPHYAGRIIRGVNNKINAPIWMQERLQRLGLNTVNLIVDVTNYVMLALGQPLHAFDLVNINGYIEVRYAQANEKITLLDGSNIKLNEDTLLIADDNKLLAIAGIMGGNDTKVTNETADIFLESAFFVPEKIALTARHYKLATDSSYRYERGVDYNLQLKALDLATSLIVTIAGGNPGETSEVISNQYLPKFSDIILHRYKVKNIIGITVCDRDVEVILLYLGMIFKPIADGWQVSIPSFRFDLKIEEDLVEEVARIFGYHNIPEQTIVASLESGEGIDSDTVVDPISKKQLSLLMRDLGYREIISYSFVDEKLQKMLNPNNNALPLANPISSEQSVMRTTLWYGLLNAAKRNLEHQKQRARFFEIGLRFLQNNGELEQKPTIAGIICGGLYPEQWGIKQNKQTDFFDLKNDVSNLLKYCCYQDVEYIPKSCSVLHPKCSAEIYIGNTILGVMGELHPAIKQQFKIDKSIFLFEIDLCCLIKRLRFNFKPFSKFPIVQRDISILVDKEISWDQIRKKIVDISAELLQNIVLFDVYCNENIGLDKRSMAIRMIFQSVSRTLVDIEVELLVNQIILVLKQTFSISLRG